MGHHIIAYFRLVGDMLIAYNTHNTDIKSTLATIDSIHPQIKLTIKKETEHSILSRHMNHKFT
jgi:hypothetical protein